MATPYKKAGQVPARSYETSRPKATANLDLRKWQVGFTSSKVVPCKILYLGHLGHAQGIRSAACTGGVRGVGRGSCPGPGDLPSSTDWTGGCEGGRGHALAGICRVIPRRLRI